jgi:mitochondrial import receptor subunit TOM40
MAMASTPDAPLAFLRKNPVFSGLSDVYNAFQERRERLGLSNPGVVENIAKGKSQTPTTRLQGHLAAAACSVAMGSI